MGLILRHNSQDTLVEENYFQLDSNNYTYGITLEISDGAKILNNTLNSTSKAGIYAIEGYATSNNDISYNKIYSEGSFSTIALYASNHNNITYNIIRARGNESQDPAQGPEPMILAYHIMTFCMKTLPLQLMLMKQSLKR